MFKNWSRWLTVGLIIALIAIIFIYFGNIITYLVVAWILSMIGQPIMQLFMRLRYKKIGLNRSIAAMFTIAAFYLFFGLLFYLFVPPIVEQAQNLASIDYTKMEANLQQPIAQLTSLLHRYGIVPKNHSIMEQVGIQLQKVANPALLGTVVGSTVSKLVELLIGISSVTFIVFFFLKDNTMFGDFLAGTVPLHYESHVRTALEDISNMLIRYFGGILIQMVGVMIILSSGLSILGVKNAMLIGFFGAVINIIPYLGPIIGAAFAALITFSSNMDLDFYNQLLPLVIKVILVFPIMHLIDGFIMQPYIFSNSVLAHPLEIFIMILVGAELAGVAGMVLAIPVYTILRVIAKVFFNEFRFVQMITENLDELDVEEENLHREQRS